MEATAMTTILSHPIQLLLVVVVLRHAIRALPSLTTRVIALPLLRAKA